MAVSEIDSYLDEVTEPNMEEEEEVVGAIKSMAPVPARPKRKKKGKPSSSPSVTDSDAVSDMSSSTPESVGLGVSNPPTLSADVDANPLSVDIDHLTNKGGVSNPLAASSVALLSGAEGEDYLLSPLSKIDKEKFEEKTEEDGADDGRNEPFSAQPSFTSNEALTVDNDSDKRLPSDDEANPHFLKDDKRPGHEDVLIQSENEASSLSSPILLASLPTTTSSFTGAFALYDDVDDAAYADSMRDSSSSSPQQGDVAMEEIKESDSSSFEYVMAGSIDKEKSSPTLSDFSQVEFNGTRQMSEDGDQKIEHGTEEEKREDEYEEEELDSPIRQKRSSTVLHTRESMEDVAVDPQAAASSADIDEDEVFPSFPKGAGVDDMGSLFGRLESNELREEKAKEFVEEEGEEVVQDELIRERGSSTYLDDDDEANPFQAGDPLVMRDFDAGAIEDDSLILDHVPPMLENEIVSQEFGRTGSMMEVDTMNSKTATSFNDAGGAFSCFASTDFDRVDHSFAANTDHPFIFAATDCTPVATLEDVRDVDAADARLSAAPPSFSASVEQFEDLGESLDNGGGGLDDAAVDTFIPDASFLSGPSFDSNGNSGRSSLSASFRGASLPRQLSSSALASQLLARSRQESFGENDSPDGGARGMAAEEADALVKQLRDEKKSLEDAVEDLKDELAQCRSVIESLKSENQSLTGRLYEMEDQIRSVEMDAKLREINEEKTWQETISKLEKQNLEMMNEITENNVELSAENEELKTDYSRTRKELDEARLELLRLEEKYLESRSTGDDMKRTLDAMEAEVETERRNFEAERGRNAEIMEEMTRELDDLKTFYSDAQPLVKMRTTSYADLPNKVSDLEAELKSMRMENSELKESKDELEGQLMNLRMNAGDGMSMTTTTTTSAAARRKGSSTSGAESLGDNLEVEMDRASTEELVKIIQTEKDANRHLREYVDKIILVILENRPELLEIMANMEVKTRG